MKFLKREWIIIKAHTRKKSKKKSGGETISDATISDLFESDKSLF